MHFIFIHNSVTEQSGYSSKESRDYVRIVAFTGLKRTAVNFNDQLNIFLQFISKEMLDDDVTVTMFTLNAGKRKNTSKIPFIRVWKKRFFGGEWITVFA